MPKIIFLDAVGTLFGVRGSVGESYSKIAKNFGVNVSPEILNSAFFQSFISATPMAFPGVETTKIPQMEFNWWREIAVKTFQKAEVFSQFSDFSTFFTALYDYFATAEPWLLYPDVKPTLERWQKQGIELAVLSNFDSRLYQVLKILDLADFFTSVTISTEVGAAKPDPKIFTTALQKYPFSAEESVHIGDSFKADYQGAKAVGIKAIWLNRDGDKTPNTTAKLSVVDQIFEQYSSLDSIAIT
ncbi:hydrolase [Oscillatoriales cyanobacterium USR001]|nr:hydrolase [Oscillatoriales cyanobacterium USR001]